MTTKKLESKLTEALNQTIKQDVKSKAIKAICEDLQGSQNYKVIYDYSCNEFVLSIKDFGTLCIGKKESDYQICEYIENMFD